MDYIRGVRTLAEDAACVCLFHGHCMRVAIPGKSFKLRQSIDTARGGKRSRVEDRTRRKFSSYAIDLRQAISSYGAVISCKNACRLPDWRETRAVVSSMAGLAGSRSEITLSSHAC
jgi:hypothetical protein